MKEGKNDKIKNEIKNSGKKDVIQKVIKYIFDVWKGF